METVSQYQIFCDLDGVLVDFIRSSLIYLNKIFLYAKKNEDELKKLESHHARYMLYKLSELVSEQIGGWDKQITIDRYLEQGYIHKLEHFIIENSSKFWENALWAPGGKRLWNFIRPYNPYILSSPVNEDNMASKIGKIKWCQKNLGLATDKIILRVNKNVHIKNKIGILIDDTPQKHIEFPDEGILYNIGDPESAIQKLKEYGFK